MDIFVWRVHFKPIQQRNVLRYTLFFSHSDCDVIAKKTWIQKRQLKDHNHNPIQKYKLWYQKNKV